MFLKALLLLYLSGISGYLLAVIIGALESKPPVKVWVAAILCAPCWPMVVAVIMYNKRRN